MRLGLPDGAAGKGCPKPHLLGVLDVSAAVFLTQKSITRKTNEIGMFAEVMDQITDLTGVLVTADAMHAQDAHATYLHARGAGLLVGLKRNQCATRRSVTSSPQVGQTRRE